MHQACLFFLGRCIRLALLCSAAVAFVVQAQDVGPNDKLYMYKGADRYQQLVKKAKEEGSLTLYTTLPATRTTPLGKAFEAKYGVKVNVWRANNEKLIQRTIAEAQAGRHTVDVIDTNGPAVESLAREKLLSQFYSPNTDDLPKFAIPPHRQWVSARMNVYVVAYNTNMLKKEDLPKTIEGFLDPKWKGRLGIESTDSAWMATLVKVLGPKKGTDFFKKLSEMDLDVRSGHILLAELVAAGEIPVALTVYNSTVESMKKKGAPIEWAIIDPMIARPQGLGLMKNAPHPHAALLFADYLISPEGQKLLLKLGVIPTSMKAPTKLNDFTYTMMDPEAELDAGDKWDKIWDELILKK